MEAISAFIKHDTDAHNIDWRRNVMKYIRRACTISIESGNRTILLDPLMVTKLDTNDYNIELTRYLLPVVMSDNIFAFYDALSNVFGDEKIFGLGRHKLMGVQGTMILYMSTRILQLFPIGRVKIDTSIIEKGDSDGKLEMMSNKYLLPLVYRLMEEGIVSDALFHIERQWIKEVDSNVSAFTMNRPHNECEKKSYAAVMKLAENKTFPLTGVSAASLPGSIPLPIEVCTADLDAFAAAMSGEVGVEVRKMLIQHPCGSWYISVMAVLCDKHFVAMAYDTLRFTMGGVTKIGSQWMTSPALTMMHLCFDAWMLEKNGISRSQGVYNLLHEYRKRDDIWNHEYTTIGAKPSEWLGGYFYLPLNDPRRPDGGSR